MQDKKELRKKAKGIRIKLDIKKISETIVQNIQDLDIYQKAVNVMIFYPIGHEVNLLGLLKDKKNFYLPKVQGRELLVCPYKVGDELAISEFKTEEPLSNPVDPNILDMIFVPALMVDKNLHRLGYGGGFYDIFLSKNCPSATKIVAIPNVLVADKIPSESFDAKIDMVITE